MGGGGGDYIRPKYGYDINAIIMHCKLALPLSIIAKFGVMKFKLPIGHLSSGVSKDTPSFHRAGKSATHHRHALQA